MATKRENVLPDYYGILLALPVSAAIAVGLRYARQSYLASDLYK